MGVKILRVEDKFRMTITLCTFSEFAILERLFYRGSQHDIKTASQLVFSWDKLPQQASISEA
jgi:hypothetical protein